MIKVGTNSIALQIMVHSCNQQLMNLDKVADELYTWRW